MPLSTIWCNVQFGTWHFKWNLCFPDERDLGRVEFEGVLHLKPYLTAWINSPLFHCWAGSCPLLVLSFNNHAGFLQHAPVYYIMYKNNKPGVRRMCQSTVRHYTAEHACMTEVPAVWPEQGVHVKLNCISSSSKAFLLHLVIFEKKTQIQISVVHIPPTTLTYQTVSLKQRSVESGLYFWNFPDTLAHKRSPCGSLESSAFLEGTWIGKSLFFKNLYSFNKRFHFGGHVLNCA